MSTKQFILNRVLVIWFLKTHCWNLRYNFDSALSCNFYRRRLAQCRRGRKEWRKEEHTLSRRFPNFPLSSFWQYLYDNEDVKMFKISDLKQESQNLIFWICVELHNLEKMIWCHSQQMCLISINLKLNRCMRSKPYQLRNWGPHQHLLKKRILRKPLSRWPVIGTSGCTLTFSQQCGKPENIRIP
jgi:hypothetical protein